MYYDIFISNPNAEIVEEPDPPVDGKLINLPGPLEAVVYAVYEPLEQAGEDTPEGTPLGKIGIMHCLVTEEQLDKIEADHIPLQPWQSIDARFKNKYGGPGHVFNPIGIRFRDEGVTKIHRIKSSETEEEATGDIEE